MEDVEKPAAGENGPLEEVELFRQYMHDIKEKFIKAEKDQEISADDQKAKANAWLARTG